MKPSSQNTLGQDVEVDYINQVADCYYLCPFCGSEALDRAIHIEFPCGLAGIIDRYTKFLLITQECGERVRVTKTARELSWLGELGVREYVNKLLGENEDH